MNTKGNSRALHSKGIIGKVKKKTAETGMQGEQIPISGALSICNIQSDPSRKVARFSRNASRRLTKIIESIKRPYSYTVPYLIGLFKHKVEP